MRTTITKFATAVAVLTMTPMVSIAAPDYFVTNGHYYEVISAPGITWDAAKLAAEGMVFAGKTGHLATITSADEDAFIHARRQAAGLSTPEAWVGGRQDPIGCTPEPGCGWTWINGEGAIPLVNGPSPYANWLSGEPNDNTGVGSENHLAVGLGNSQGWNDEGALGNIGGYIVEYDVTTVATVVPGLNTLFFNQAKLNSNNPLTAGYQQVLNGGLVTISCCRVLDKREGAGTGGRYGAYSPVDLDLGMEMADTLTNPTCDGIVVPAGSAILKPWQRGVPKSKGIDFGPELVPATRENDLGVCLVQSQVESRGVVFTAEQAKNVLGFALDYRVPSIDYRPFTAGTSQDPVEVDFPEVVPWTGEIDESQSGKRFSTNVFVINLWHFRPHNDTLSYLQRMASGLKNSIDQLKTEGCVENNAGFLDSLDTRLQSAKKDMQKKGNPATAVATLYDATRLGMLIAPYDDIGDPYGACPDNPQGLVVGRFLSLAHAACSELLRPNSDASSLHVDGCRIPANIRAALPPLPGF